MKWPFKTPFEGAGHFQKHSQYAPSHDHVVNPACVCNISCHVVGIDSQTVYNPNLETRSRGTNVTNVKRLLGIWGIFDIFGLFVTKVGQKSGFAKNAFQGVGTKTFIPSKSLSQGCNKGLLSRVPVYGAVSYSAAVLAPSIIHATGALHDCSHPDALQAHSSTDPPITLCTHQHH